MDMGLAGRTVLITGASRNIGRETALKFAEEGANVALCTRQSIDELEAVAAEVRELDVLAIATQCDITDEASVGDFIDLTVKTFGKLDVVVNNAVFRGESDFFDIDAESWQRNIDINLTGPFNVCKHAIPHMVVGDWGRVVNYSGIAPYLGHGAAKSMVKLGIVGFTRGIAAEFAKNNITANCIGPGLIDVEREEWQRDKPLPPGQPVRRLGTPEEIASLAVYLASEQSAYITGQCYLANGGQYFLG